MKNLNVRDLMIPLSEYATVSEDVELKIRRIAGEVAGVLDVEKCRIRKSGLSLLMDIHITVDGNISVNEGHRIGHVVKDRLIASRLPIEDVVVHVEPDHLISEEDAKADSPLKKERKEAQ